MRNVAGPGSFLLEGNSVTETPEVIDFVWALLGTLDHDEGDWQQEGRYGVSNSNYGERYRHNHVHKTLAS